MEQHPIPQQISSYQFKLVGDMTLKQFFQLAGGIVISLIFYSTPLHPLIKWPFVFFFAGLGAALAFLPFQERPLERWIFAFFRSIYSPTLFFWKKTDKPPIFYTETATAPAITTIANTGPIVEKNTAKLEDAEKSFLSKIGGLWNVAGATQGTANSQQPIAIPSVQATVVPPILEPVTHTLSPVTLKIPEITQITIPKSQPKLVVEESVRPLPTNVSGTDLYAQKIENKPISSNEVEFSIDAAPPSPPIVINTVVGQVMDEERKIIEGAILEIKDSSGRPVRALKSNRAGHFIIVTPLANGKYEITTEKDGFTFDPVSFETKGEMIPAIAIRGKHI